MKTIKILLFAVLLPSLAFAQADTAAAPTPDGAEQIVITGSAPAYQIRQLVNEAEEQMHDIFNQLNDDYRFDISCSTTDRYNSHMASRSCQPNFEIDLSALEARGYQEEILSYVNDGPGVMPAGSARPKFFVDTHFEMEQQRQAMKRKIEQLAKESPEYRAAIINYVKLKEQYTQRLQEGKR